MAPLDELAIDGAVLVGQNLGGEGWRKLSPSVNRDALTHAIGYHSGPIPSVSALPGLRATVPPAARSHSSPDDGHPAGPWLRRPARAREALDVHWRPYARNEATAGLARQVTAPDLKGTLAVARRLPELDVPARIVWDAADQSEQVRYRQRLDADLNAELLLTEGGKDFVPDDHPKEIADAIGNVLVEV